MYADDVHPQPRLPLPLARGLDRPAERGADLDPLLAAGRTGRRTRASGRLHDPDRLGPVDRLAFQEGLADGGEGAD